MKSLEETFGSKVTASLIYRASRDGWDGTDYHRFCDNKGPTVALIMTTKEVLVGAFLMIPILS
jgi:hypothetical protein